MKSMIFATAAALTFAAPVVAEPLALTLDPTHSAVNFTWSHGDFSTTFGMFFEVSGDVMFDEASPDASSVSVSFPLGSMIVDPTLKGHLAGERWFGTLDQTVTFTSTSIEITGDDTALITGDLAVGEMTSEVVLDTTFNKGGAGPQGKDIYGFDATTTVLRSNYGVGAFAPFVSDALDVMISIEASPAS